MNLIPGDPFAMKTRFSAWEENETEKNYKISIDGFGPGRAFEKKSRVSA